MCTKRSGKEDCTHFPKFYISYLFYSMAIYAQNLFSSKKRFPFHSSPPQVVLSGPVLGETWPPPCPGIPTNLNTNGHLRPHPPLFPVFRIKLSASKAVKSAKSAQLAQIPIFRPRQPASFIRSPEKSGPCVRDIALGGMLPVFILQLPCLSTRPVFQKNKVLPKNLPFPRKIGIIY